MSKPVITIHPNLTVQTACKYMSKYSIGSLVVADKHKPVGIVTERDVIIKVIAKGKDPKKMTVGKIMSVQVATADIRDTFMKVADMMQSKNYRRIVITDTGDIVGILTSRDLIKMISA